MTEPAPVLENTTVFQVIWDALRATDLFGARIWKVGTVPVSTPTFPFASVQPLGNVNIQYGTSGDGGQLLNMQQAVQVNVFQASTRDEDPTLPGDVVRALQSLQADVHGGRVQFRFSMMTAVPAPADDLTVHQALTFNVYHQLEAL